MPDPLVCYLTCTLNPPEPPRRKFVRIRGFDYGTAGSYFITVCVKDMALRFGVVQDGKACLNPLGTLVKTCLLETSAHFDGIEIDSYIVMPNHVHAICVIWDPGVEPESDPDPRDPGVPFAWVRMLPKESSGPPKRALATVVGSFESAVSRRARQEGLINGRLWQRGYFERIIRNERELIDKRRYIAENPFRWSLERGP